MARTEQPWQWTESTWRDHVQHVRAGRRLMPTWPEGARVAVALSFDSDHETVALRDGQVSPGRLSQGQYGNRVAVPRIRETLARHDVRATFFVPAVSALLYPEEQRCLVGEGHEIALHGWIHERNSQLARSDERELMHRSADTLEKITGARPCGLRTPSWEFSANTLTIIREMGLIYDSSLMADDEPYELMERNEPTGVVEIPVEWIRDDAVYFNMSRFDALRPYTPPSAVLGIFKAEFDAAHREGGLFQLTMHPHHIGHRSRMTVLDDLISHMKAKGQVWFATHGDVARLCREEMSNTDPKGQKP